MLEVDGRAGIAGGLGSGAVPFYEAYYLGGMYDLRGYDYHTVGPQVPFTVYTNQYFYGPTTGPGATNSPTPFGTNTVPNNLTNAPSFAAATNNEAIGGDTYWFVSAEYSLPLIDRLRFAMFYDAGMVYPGTFSITPLPRAPARITTTSASGCA